ncbi:MAG TPA: DinB family protein, partial [Gaiellaceae bacterium]|nr:DinB family protein [Gaiellaceae bacterium]
MSPTELEAVLEHARKRTEALLEPFDDQQLTGQVSPLQSPLVWDLAHIGYFEELWLLRNGNDDGGGLGDLYDSFAHERAERGTLPILPPAEARAYVTNVREKVLERLPELAQDD